MNLQSLIGSLALELLEITVLEVFQRVEIRDEQRIRLELHRVVDELRRLPAHRADRKVIKSQLDVPSWRGERGSAHS